MMQKQMNPGRMTLSEQMSEVSQILAMGFMRARQREMRGKVIQLACGEKDSDFPSDGSAHCTSKRKEESR